MRPTRPTRRPTPEPTEPIPDPTSEPTTEPTTRPTTERPTDTPATPTPVPSVSPADTPPGTTTVPAGIPDSSWDDAGGGGWEPPTTEPTTAIPTPDATTAVSAEPAAVPEIAGLVPDWLAFDPATSGFTIDLSAAGSNIRISGSRVIVTGEQADLIVAATDVTTASDSISGIASTLEVYGHPLRLDGSTGHMVCSYHAALTALPGSGARINATFAEAPDRSQERTFGQAAAAMNGTFGGIAGVMAVQTADAPPAGAATIWMSAPAAWVEGHGGDAAIRILMIGDRGEAEVLDTTFIGTGEEETLVFEGASPRGLATFGLAAIVSAETRSAIISSEPGSTQETFAAARTETPAALAVETTAGPANGTAARTAKTSAPVPPEMLAAGLLVVSTAILGGYLVRSGRFRRQRR